MTKRPSPKIGNPRVDGPTHEESAALRAARKAASLERRRPDAADAPPLTTFPGPKAKPLPGQERLL